MLRGSALNHAGSPHYETHKSLEIWWDQFRRDGPLADRVPTNAEYDAAMEKSLKDGGISPKDARAFSETAKAQRIAAGLIETADVPRVLGRINQSPTMTVDADLWRARSYANNLAVVGRGMTVVGAGMDAHSLYSEVQTSRQTGNYGNTVQEAGRIVGGWSSAVAVGGAFGQFGAGFGFVVGGPIGAVVGGFIGGLLGGGIGYYVGGNAVSGIIHDFR